jgi:hypothetical protein
MIYNYINNILTDLTNDKLINILLCIDNDILDNTLLDVMNKIYDFKIKNINTQLTKKYSNEIDIIDRFYFHQHNYNRIVVYIREYIIKNLLCKYENNLVTCSQLKFIQSNLVYPTISELYNNI